MADDYEYTLNIVIDNGSSYIKAGLSGEEEPKAVSYNDWLF